MADDEQSYDVRTIDRRLRDGDVDRDEYEDYIENLPDVADKARKVEAEFVEGVLEDDEEEELPAEESEEVEVDAEEAEDEEEGEDEAD